MVRSPLFAAFFLLLYIFVYDTNWVLKKYNMVYNGNINTKEGIL